MSHSTMAFDEWVVSKDQLADRVAELSSAAYEGPERRHSERHPLVVTVEAVPLNDSFESLSLPTFKMFSCDISDRGIGLIYVHSIEANYLALTMHSYRGSEIKLMTKVVRCTPTDVDPNLYNIGAKFVTRDH